MELTKKNSSTGNWGTKVRLATMSFLEFAVWGTYLISMGMFLANHGLGSQVFWFYTVQGLVSIFMPALVGIVADRWVPAQITFSICHLLAGGFMIAAGLCAADMLASTGQLEFGKLFTLYTLSVAFFMPTIGLGNSVAFNGLERVGLDTVKDFPPIRTLRRRQPCACPLQSDSSFLPHQEKLRHRNHGRPRTARLRPVQA